MSIRILFVFFIVIIVSCSSDDITTKEKNEVIGVFRDVYKQSFPDKTETFSNEVKKKTNQWLSEFKQPIILISSIDEKTQATLVALGNNKERLTCC